MTIIIRAKSAKLARTVARNTVKACFNLQYPASEKRHKNGYVVQYWIVEKSAFFDRGALNQIMSEYVWKYYKHNNNKIEIDYSIE